ncbi:14-3-3 protein, putative [Plasmodium malariae]|uniref:14-3-3 protein, putative n=1 Tax=Plasmodium malariae TaxID=5858 RepID=A0A1C3KZC5_PLAMA|nr:14-3-3 protein, putative [Plasmodium malariae]
MKPHSDNDILVSNKEEFIYFLKILNHIGFYDEMVSLIKRVNAKSYNLNYAESLLMGSTFKNALNVRRKEQTVLENIITNKESTAEEKYCAELLKSKLNKDIRSIEKNTYTVIKTKYIPKTNDDECSKTIGILGILRDNINKWCEISGRKNVDALFEIKGENLDKYRSIIYSIHS